MDKSDAAIYARWRAKLAARRTLLKRAQARLKAARKADTHPRQQLVDLVHKREKQVAQAEAVCQRHKRKPLRERAYEIAAGQVGVMESGANNAGTPYTRYERPNGATGPEAWCGDFQAWVYRKAGSKRVQRAWAAVRLIRGLYGIKATKTPHRGDLARFDFPGEPLAHVGMFVRWLKVVAGRYIACSQHEATHIETIEGNTGATGAVSDSTTGGDGVYRKVRARELVHDFLHVLG